MDKPLWGLRVDGAAALRVADCPSGNAYKISVMREGS